MYDDKMIYGFIATCVQASGPFCAGEVRALHWMDTLDLAFKRASEWCLSHGHDPDEWVVLKIQGKNKLGGSFIESDFKFVLCNGPQYRVEVWGQQKTL